MATLNSLLDRFLRERTYLKNVSPKTRVWYETAWKTFLRTQGPGFGTTPIDSPQAITRQHLQEFVVALRDRGVRPVTVNTWVCALNAFCRWLHEEGTTLREPVRLRRLKVQRVATAPPPGMSALRRGRNRVMCAWGRRSCPSTHGPQAGRARQPGRSGLRPRPWPGHARYRGFRRAGCTGRSPSRPT
jgi:hypothetical protein